jgi:Flp pilus assembly protein TadG
MLSFLRKVWRDRRGNALVIAGAALPLIIGSAGLATDTIQWAMWKRQLQRAADSGAIAGVYGKMASQTVSTGACSASAPVSRDQTIGQVTTRLGTTPTCTIESPVTSGAWTAAGFSAVKVTVAVQRRLSFSGLFMSATPTITASATAAVVQAGKYCAKALDNKNETGIEFIGNATVDLGCGIITNAKGADAIDGGGSATVTASPVAAQGQISNDGAFTDGTVFQPYSPPTTDPYANINPPTVPNGCNQTAVKGNQTSINVSSGTPCYTDITLTNGQSATFQDVTVIINGGDLSVNAGATLNCIRCTFILTTNDTNITSNSIGNVTFNGGATINLVAPTTGTYSGLVIYQDRRAPYCQNCNKVNGNSSSIIEGAMYFPTQELQISGDSGMDTKCVQMVAWQLAFTGNTSISNTCPGGPRGWDGSMVRLVE